MKVLINWIPVILLLFTSFLCYSNYQLEDYLPKTKYEIRYTDYVIDYDEENHIPRFAYYKIESSKLDYFGRNNFEADWEVSSCAQPWEYTGTGYDRGHLFPSSSATSEMQSYDSYWMTNIAPQTPSFNRGLWKRLENFEQYNSDPQIYVVSGTYIGESEEKLNNRIAVPEYFYKILYNPGIGMIAFLVKQSDQGSIQDYVVPVDKIETLVNIDFFYQLPDSKEIPYERDISLINWQW